MQPLQIPIPRTVHVCFDFHGCPNNCRHCWLGSRTPCSFSRAQAEQFVSRLRNWKSSPEGEPHFQRVSVHSWLREPDFSADYRSLWEWEQHMSDPGAAERFELMSIWRLARDPAYVEFVSTQKPRFCQITWHGSRERTDWFFQREGAYADNIAATEALLQVGIAPRFQYFITQSSIEDLSEFEALVKGWFEPRCRSLGLPCTVFLNTAAPNGNGWQLEEVRLEEGDTHHISAYLTGKTLEHLQLENLDDVIGRPESYWMEELKKETQPAGVPPDRLMLNISGDGGIYWAEGELADHWKLGDADSDDFSETMRRFEKALPPGLDVRFRTPVGSLATSSGDATSRRLYSRDDMVARWEKLALARN